MRRSLAPSLSWPGSHAVPGSCVAAPASHAAAGIRAAAPASCATLGSRAAAAASRAGRARLSRPVVCPALAPRRGPPCALLSQPLRLGWICGGGRLYRGWESWDVPCSVRGWGERDDLCQIIQGYFGPLVKKLTRP